MAKVVIIGAGLTGLSTAYHLEAQGFFDYKIFEKESEVGGLCRSVSHDGFTFDFTGHLLHINNPYFQSFIETIIGLDHFNLVTRHSFIYSHGVHTNYPFQINLHGLPESVIVECIEEFATRNKFCKKTNSYYQWVLETFGKGFGKHFFFPYQEKIFAYDVRKLTNSWTGRFVPSTTLKQIIRGAIRPDHGGHVGYNATFLYPKHGGIAWWVNKLAQQLINPINTTHEVITVDLKQNIVCFANGHIEPFEQLVSTIPLNLFLRGLQETSSTNLQSTHTKLLCNSVINFNLGITHSGLPQKSWIYYPEKQFPFYRLGFPHTFSQKMVPNNCSSLYGEIAHLNQSSRTIKQKLRQALTATKQLLTIHEHEIRTEKVMHIPHAYVIYNAWREKNLHKIHKQLQSLDIYSIGRYGGWKYSSMQEAVLEGKTMADTLITKPAQRSLFIPQSIRKKQTETETST